MQLDLKHTDAIFFAKFGGLPCCAYKLLRCLATCILRSGDFFMDDNDNDDNDRTNYFTPCIYMYVWGNEGPTM